MADIDIKIRLQAAKAEADLAKFTSQVERSRLSVQKAQLQNSILQKRLQNTGKAASSSGKNFLGLQRAVSSFVGNLASTATTAAFNFLRQSLVNGVNDFIEYEKALIAVGRTAGLTAEKQKELGVEIDKLTKIIPLSATELLNFSKIAGQLGVSEVDQLTKFTETFAKLSVATNIAGEESAIAFTRILGLTDELEENGVENIEKLGSVITALGNTTKALETDIVNVGVEVAKGLAPFKIGSETVAAFGATLAESGVQSAAAGSALQRVFTNIAKASANGGKELEKFALATGMTAEEFKNLFDENPEQAFLNLAKSLSEAGLAPGELLQVFEQLGIKQIRVQRSLLPLITNYKKLEQNVNLANKESRERNALNDEAQKAFDTLGSDVGRLSEAFSGLTRELAEGLAPILRVVVKGMTSFIDTIRESTLLQAFAVALGIVAVGLGTVATAAVLSATGFGGLATAAAAAWAALFAPVTLVIAGIALVGAAIFILVKKWNDLVDTAKSWLGISKKVKEDGDKTKKSFEGLKGEANELSKGFENTGKSADMSSKSLDKQGASANNLAADLKNLGGVKEQEDTKDTERQRAALERFKQFARERTEIEEERRRLDLESKLIETENFVNFNNGKLEELARFFTEEEIVKQEARLQTIDNEREFQLELDRLVNEGISRRNSAIFKGRDEDRKIQSVANKIIEEDNKEFDKKNLQNKQRFFSDAISLSRSNNEALAAIGKAAALVQIAIDTQEAVSGAYAYGNTLGGPPVGAAFAGIAAAAQAARAANVAGIQGFENGGIVGGTSFTGDQVPVRVNSGEAILNRQQQTQLFNLANGASPTGRGQEIVVNTTVELDGEAVGQSVSRQVANGLQLGEVQ